MKFCVYSEFENIFEMGRNLLACFYSAYIQVFLLILFAKNISIFSVISCQKGSFLTLYRRRPIDKRFISLDFL